MYSYGDDSPTCVAVKREHLFRDNNKDLALVTKMWPELLPTVRAFLTYGEHLVMMVLVWREGGDDGRGGGGNGEMVTVLLVVVGVYRCGWCW